MTRISNPALWTLGLYLYLGVAAPTLAQPTGFQLFGSDEERHRVAVAWSEDGGAQPLFGESVTPSDVSALGPEEGRAELPGFAARLGRDVRDLVLAPARMRGRQWRAVGLAVLAVGAIGAFDGELRDLVHSEDPGIRRFAEAVRPIGHQGAFVLLGAGWLLGRAADRPRLQAMAEDGLEATLLSSGLVAQLLKNISGRARPREGLGSATFQNGHESFPSGEVTQAFAIATVVSAHSERKWIQGLAWGLAGLTAWQRVELDAHWGSDVAAGALIGIGVGRWVVRRNRQRGRVERRWTMAPRIDERGGYGVELSTSF